MRKVFDKPQWLSLEEALRTFGACDEGTQAQKHIRAMHWYTACRLVVEGGFHPDTITPRPPFVVKRSAEGPMLKYDPEAGVAGEQTIFGGLKTKSVDVVVSLPGIGPVIAVSMKGTLNAFRNLTNRMEEAAGDCTNMHLAYPGLVYAFWHVFRANTEGSAPPGTPSFIALDGGCFKPPDVAVRRDGGLTSYLARYFFAMERLSGRADMRDDPSSYEAVGMTLVDVRQGSVGKVVSTHPPHDSVLRHERMFEIVYRQYDLRFVYQSPALKEKTRRAIWSERSPVCDMMARFDYLPRIGSPEPTDEADAMEDESAG